MNGDWGLWKGDIEAFLTLEEAGLVDYVQPVAAEGFDAAKDAKCKAILRTYVADCFKQQVTSAPSASAAYQLLKSKFVCDDLRTVLRLNTELSTARKQDGESCEQWVGRLEAIHAQLKAAQHEPPKGAVELAVIRGLPPSYAMWKTSVSLRPSGEITLTWLREKLFHEEQRQADESLFEQQQATAAVLAAHAARSSSNAHAGPSGRGFGNWRGSGMGRGRGRGNGRAAAGGAPAQQPHGGGRTAYGGAPAHSTAGAGRSQAPGPGRQDRPYAGCWNCGELDHKQSQCPYATGACTGVVCAAALDQNPDTWRDAWVLDSGCSMHVCGNRNLFTQLGQLKEPISVTFGNGQVVQASGIGRVYWPAAQVFLVSVLYVPECALNLISVSAATQSGWSVCFEADSERGTVENAKVGAQLTVTRREGLYVLDQEGCIPTPSVGQTVLSAQAALDAQLWHKRFGHLSYSGLQTLHRHGMVVGLEVSNKGLSAAMECICEVCVLAKQHRGPFYSSPSRTTRVLELVHMDVCGPIEVPSLGGKRYFVTLLDDWSGWSIVVPIAAKSQVAEVIILELERWMTQTGQPLQRVRTDNGGEFLARMFSEWCAGRGVLHEKSAPYTPEQNGAAERLNRTLVERVRAMLYESGLSKRFWAEAVKTACWVRNRSPVKGAAVTPYERMWGRQPDVSRMRVFGCRAFAFVPAELRKKLDPVSKPGIFVGYDNEVNWRVYHAGTEHISCSKHVIFDERNKGQSAPPVEPPPESGEGYVLLGMYQPAPAPQQGGDGEAAQPAAGNAAGQPAAAEVRAAADVQPGQVAGAVGGVPGVGPGVPAAAQPAAQGEPGQVPGVVADAAPEVAPGVPGPEAQEEQVPGVAADAAPEVVPGVPEPEAPAQAPVQARRRPVLRRQAQVPAPVVEDSPPPPRQTASAEPAAAEPLIPERASGVPSTSGRPSGGFRTVSINDIAHGRRVRVQGVPPEGSRGSDAGPSARAADADGADEFGVEGPSGMRPGARSRLTPSYLRDYITVGSKRHHSVMSAQVARPPGVEMLEAPITVEEAMSRPDADRWKEAMQEELTSLHEHNTWDLVECPLGVKPVPCRWVFTLVKGQDGFVQRYKARLVAKGYAQREGIDYGEVFAPVSTSTTLRSLLAVVAARDLELEQVDIKTAFLNGELEEDVWMVQPPGFEQPGLVCKLNKSLYGLKQAPRAWHERLKAELASIGAQPSRADPCLYILRQEEEVSYILVYVDDCLIASSSRELIGVVKAKLQSVFTVHDLGQAHVFLGVVIERDRENRILKISQRRMALDVVERFGMAEARVQPQPMREKTELRQGEGERVEAPYAQLVGSLLYLAGATRPDLAFVASALARFMSNPQVIHWKLAKDVLAYLAGTADLGIVYGGEAGLCAWADADYAGDRDAYKSTAGFVFTFGGGAVSWKSKRQPTVALSTLEAEMQAACLATREVLWLRDLLWDLGVKVGTVELACDSQAVIANIKHPVVSSRAKHVGVVREFVYDHVVMRDVSFFYCPTAEMVADVFTKPLNASKLVPFRQAMGMS